MTGMQHRLSVRAEYSLLYMHNHAFDIQPAGAANWKKRLSRLRPMAQKTYNYLKKERN